MRPEHLNRHVIEVQDLIDRSGAAAVAVAYHDIATGDQLLIRPDEPFHPASTIKLCVMMTLYHLAAGGMFSLDERIPITNEFHSIVDGSPYSLSAADDAETSLYGRIGAPECLRELTRLMIAQSSNLATNILIERVTPEAVTSFMRRLGASGLLVRRGVEDNKAYALGLNNVATARGLMRALVRLARREVVSPQSSGEMTGVLLGQAFNEGIPARLPPGTRVAHKTGWNERLYHDAAIVYPPGRESYVLVVLTRGIAEGRQAHELVAAVSRALYTAG